MQAITKTLFAVGLASAVSMTQAATIEQLFYIGEVNQLSDNSAEGQNVDLNGNSFLDPGDTLRGTFDWNTIEGLQSGSGPEPIGAGGNNELSGIFETEVISRTFVGPGADLIVGTGDDLYNFVFGVHAGFAAEFGLPAGALIAMWEDDTPDYNRVAPIATAEATATNGILRWVLGFGADPGLVNPNGSGAQGDEIWLAFGAPQDPSIAKGVPAGSGIGTFNFQTSTLYETFANTNFGFVNCTPTGFGDGLCGTNAQGGLVGTQGINTGYDVFNNIDMTFYPERVPEPATIAILGMGLFGISAARRRKTS